jgi:hypothetical protein
MTFDRTKPEFDAPAGPAPAELEIHDIIVGDGAEAKPGATVTIHYAGVDFESGEEFDSSWSRGEAAQFPLGMLIKGWSAVAVSSPSRRTSRTVRRVRVTSSEARPSSSSSTSSRSKRHG